jgi:flagellar biogenesis protein FliO
MESLFGVEMPTAGKVLLALVVVIALIGGITWAVRRFGADRFGGSSARGRQPRLAVIDAAAVDGRRRLVLIRRDNVEHLLMIGGPTDVVVEPNIVRAVGAPRELPREALPREQPRDMPREQPREAPPVRVTPALDTSARPTPMADDTMWPLQPQSEPTPRPPRPVVPEEPMPWTATPDPTARPSRPADAFAGLAEELSARTPQRDFNLSGARAAAPEPGRAAAPQQPSPVEPSAMSPASDPNLSDMAQRLEAALRAPNDMRRGAEASAKPDPKAAPPVASELFGLRGMRSNEPARPPASEPKPATPRAEVKPVMPESKPATPSPEVKPPRPEAATAATARQETKPAAPRPEAVTPRPEAKPAQPKSLYDSLEQEMASLLGRPPGKP